MAGKIYEPKIIGFLCNWCSYAGADLAGSTRLKYPPNLKIIRVPCSGRVSPELVIRTFREGADGVMVLGATNRPELLDPALLRPGRFDHHLHIPLPDREARSAILGVHKPNMPFDDEAEEYLQVLADYTEGYSGADLAELMRKASTLALRRSGWDPTSCHMERSDLEEALTQMRRQKARIEGLGLDAREERRS